MWEHFRLCIKEPSANLQNTNKVTGCARTPIEKPGTSSACTTSRSAVFILECMALRVPFIFAIFSLFFFFSFYWSKFSIANSLQQNNKYGTFKECFSYCKKHFCRQKQKSHGAAAILQASAGQVCSSASPASVFWSPSLCWPHVLWAIGWQKSQIRPSAPFIPSPLSFVYHEGKTQCNIQEIS